MRYVPRPFCIGYAAVVSPRWHTPAMSSGGCGRQRSPSCASALCSTLPTWPLNLAEPRGLLVTPADSSLWPGNRSAPIYRTGQSSSMESGGATPPRAIRWTSATARHVGFPASVRRSAPGGGIPTPGFIHGTLHMQLHASAQAATCDPLVILASAMSRRARARGAREAEIDAAGIIGPPLARAAGLLPANADCTGADSHGPSAQAIESKL
jgi:hypothetical protein